MDRIVLNGRLPVPLAGQGRSLPDRLPTASQQLQPVQESRGQRPFQALLEAPRDGISGQNRNGQQGNQAQTILDASADTVGQPNQALPRGSLLDISV